MLIAYNPIPAASKLDSSQAAILAATPFAVSNTLVKRDALGGFSAGAIIASSIKITTAPALGKILSSDATGNSSWITNTGFTTVSGGNNIAYGLGAGATLNGTSGESVVIGHNAGSGLISGQYNTAIGASTLTAPTIQSYNTAVGNGALGVAVSPGSTAVGYLSGGAITSGSFNTVVGCQAGASLTTNTNCVALGYLADISAGLTNSTAIGNHAVCSTSNSIQLGNTAITTVSTTGAFSAGSLSTAGNVSCSSLTFPSGTLSYYEEYDHVTAFILSTITSLSVTIRFTRIGRQVTAHVPLISTLNAATLSSGPSLVSTAAFPSRFRSSNPCMSFVSVNNDELTPVSSSGCAIITAAGLIEIHPTTSVSSYSVSGAYYFGFSSFSATWTV
jgi:hypothetical protein